MAKKKKTKTRKPSKVSTKRGSAKKTKKWVRRTGKAKVVAGSKKSKKPRAAAEAAAPAPTLPPPKPGSLVWHELMTTDVARSKSFYAELFGWKHADMEMMPGFNYTVISHIKQDIGGMMQLTPEHGEMQSHWLTYVSTRDVDATAQKAELLGGEVLVPPHDIPVGRWAKIKDPTGAMICIYKSKRR